MKKYFDDARRIELDRNEVLHRADEKCVNLGYILSGRLLLKKYLSSGKELYIAEFYPGEMYGELLVLAGEEYKGWLIADEKTEVLELDINSLNKLMSDSSFKKMYFHRISEKVSKMTERIEILSYKKVSDRIILYLLSHYDESNEYNINITTLRQGTRLFQRSTIKSILNT